MEAYLTSQIIGSLSEGDTKKFIAYVAIFFLLWLELRGVKKEVAKITNPSGPIFKALENGEKRFDQLEARQKSFDERLTKIEDINSKPVTMMSPQQQTNGV